MLERKKISADLCVIGGGLAGISAAIAAAREGIKVAPCLAVTPRQR